MDDWATRTANISTWSVLFKATVGPEKERALLFGGNLLDSEDVINKMIRLASQRLAQLKPDHTHESGRSSDSSVGI